MGWGGDVRLDKILGIHWTREGESEGRACTSFPDHGSPAAPAISLPYQSCTQSPWGKSNIPRYLL